MLPISFGQAPRTPRPPDPLFRCLGCRGLLLGGCTWDWSRRRRTRTRRRGRTWHVGEPVEEGSSPRDRIPREECESRQIVTSRAGGQRGSEWDVVRKSRCRSHVGATGTIWGSGNKKQKALKQRVRTGGFLSSFSFSSSTAPPACPSGARELPRTTRRLICEAEDWLSTSPHAPVR